MEIFENLQMKWFSASNPVNKKKASVTIGSGDNGIVTVECDTYGTSGNAFSVDVIVGTGNDVNLSAVLSESKITVTLGTGATGAVDNAKNTATLIASAISAIHNFTATASGTGETAFTEAIAESNLIGGQWATPCRQLGTLVRDNTYYYVCSTEGNESDTVWKRFTLADY